VASRTQYLYDDAFSAAAAAVSSICARSPRSFRHQRRADRWPPQISQRGARWERGRGGRRGRVRSNSDKSSCFRERGLACVRLFFPFRFGGVVSQPLRTVAWARVPDAS
jgi:hypothetical protein